MSNLDPYFFLTVIPAGAGLPPVKLEGTIPQARDRRPETRVTQGPVDLRATVTSLSYEDSEKESDKLMFSVDNFTLALFESPLFRTGSIIHASWGYPGNMSPTRECVVQKIEGFNKLNVTCFSRDALMNKVQRTRVFERKTRHAIVAQIAEENGFGPTARHIDQDPSGEVLETLPQARLTDAALLRTLANLLGYEFYVDYDGLHWHKRRTAQRPIKQYEYYVAKIRGEIINIKITNDVFARKTGGTTVKGAAPDTKTPVVASGDNTTSTATTVAETRDLFTGVDGRDGRVLDTTEKATGSSAVAPSSGATKTPEATKAAAVGQYDRHQLNANKATLEAIGDPQLRAKAPIELLGASVASGKWWVKKAKHTLAHGAGYKITLELGREGPSKKGGAVTPQNPNDSKPKPPTDPSSIFHEPGGGLAQVSGVDGRVTFVEQAGAAPPETQSVDPTAFYRE